MQCSNLKEWLENDSDNHWGLQVILDTLALGENIPLRLVSLSALQDLYGNINTTYTYLLANPETESPEEQTDLAENAKKFQQLCPSQDAFQQWVIQELNQISQHVKDTPTKRDYVPHAQVIRSLSTQVFITLTANELPVENLIRIELPQWEWLQILWLYQHAKLEQLAYDHPFGIQQCYLYLHALDLNITREINDVPLLDDLTLMIGPMITTEVSLFAEESYDKNTVQVVIDSIEKISGYFSEKNFSITRVRKAIQAEPTLPLQNVNRRHRRLLTTLDHILAFKLNTQQALDAHCLRVMSFWGMSNIQRHELILEKSAQDTPVVCMEMQYEPDSIHNEKKPPLVLASELSQAHIELSLQENTNTFWTLQAKEYGSNLRIFPATETTKEALELFAIRMGHSFLRLDQKTKLLEQKEVLVFTEWLQSRTGSLFPGDKESKETHTNRQLYERSSKQICRWIAETLRAELCILFAYEDSAGREGELLPLNSYSRSAVPLTCRRQMEQDMVDIAHDKRKRARSIAYRAIHEGRQQTCYSYEQATGESIPTGQTLYRSKATCDCHPPYKMVISTPIKFNNRLLGVIEVSAAQPWRFRYNRQTSLQRIATVIAPFIYQHEHLRALHDTQMAVLQLHADKIDASELYHRVCKAMSRLFLSKGAALWIRDSVETKVFSCAGFHNTSCYTNSNHKPVQRPINDSLFASGGYIQELENKNTKRIDGIGYRDLKNGSPELSNRHKCLIDEGISSLSILPIISKHNTDQPIIASLSIYNSHDTKYDEAWLGIAQFISSHLSFIIEAVNAFITERGAKESLHTHELWHDVSYLADKARKIAKGNEYHRKRLDALLSFINTPWFKNKLEVGQLLGIINKNTANQIMLSDAEIHHAFTQEIQQVRHELEVDLFLPQQDMMHYIKTIKLRLNILFGKNPDRYDQEYLRVFKTSGSREIAELTRYNINLSKVDLRHVYDSIIQGNRVKNDKGLFFNVQLVTFPQRKFLYMSALLMQTIMINLLTNSVKYSLPNSKVDVLLDFRKDGSLLLSIANDGISMESTSEYRRVLGYKVRGSNASKQPQETGLGMGLFIVNQVCRHILSVDFSFKERHLTTDKSRYIAEILFPSEKVMTDDRNY